MKAYSLKVLVIHLAIALSYTVFNYYHFVIGRFPDPIGTGLRQWLCILLHIVLTLFITLTLLGRATDKKLAKRKFILHFFILLSIFAVGFLVDAFIWDWLWNFR